MTKPQQRKLFDNITVVSERITNALMFAYSLGYDRARTVLIQEPHQVKMRRPPAHVYMIVPAPPHLVETVKHWVEFYGSHLHIVEATDDVDLGWLLREKASVGND